MPTSASAPIGENPTTYDEMPYPSAAFAQSHPNRLAAMARLFGVPAADPSRARVLELGCADGSNLLPMAEQSPHGRYLGIDASRVQVATGQKAITAAALNNVELRFQNILEFPASEGKFDYIIAHGIYSWVPPAVREKMLLICQEHLAENGVAYISYNALPGWNMRRSLRDMMLFHTHGISDPRSKVQQARALLKFLSDAVPTENNAYGMLLKSELDLFSKAADNYFRHDILEEENTAFYFYQFCQSAERHGLQYLSEPNLAEMLAANFPDNVNKTLAQVSGNIVAQEQYMDFIRNRLFRQTLLCRREVQITRKIAEQRIREFAFQSRLKSRTEPVDLSPGVAVSFDGENGNKLTTSDSFVKAVFALLAETNARALSFNQLLELARAKTRAVTGTSTPSHDEVEVATLGANLFKLYVKSFIDILAEPVAISLGVPERPALSPLMRHQALNSAYITNRVHRPIPADIAGRYVMTLCDGTRTRDQIVDALVQFALEGKINVAEDNKPVTDAVRLKQLLIPRVDTLLPLMARNGFFAP